MDLAAALDWLNRNQGSIEFLTFLATSFGLLLVVIQIRSAARSVRAENDRQRRLETLSFYNLFREAIRSDHLIIRNHFPSTLLLDTNQVKKIRGDEKLKATVLNNLSRLERLSVGVKVNVYDKDIIYNISRAQLISMWDYYAEYVSEARKKTPDAYTDFESLVVEFKDKSREEMKRLPNISLVRSRRT